MPLYWRLKWQSPSCSTQANYTNAKKLIWGQWIPKLREFLVKSIHVIRHAALWHICRSAYSSSGSSENAHQVRTRTPEFLVSMIEVLSPCLAKKEGAEDQEGKLHCNPPGSSYPEREHDLQMSLALQSQARWRVLCVVCCVNTRINWTWPESINSANRKTAYCLYAKKLCFVRKYTYRFLSDENWVGQKLLLLPWSRFVTSLLANWSWR